MLDSGTDGTADDVLLDELRFKFYSSGKFLRIQCLSETRFSNPSCLMPMFAEENGAVLTLRLL